MKQFKDFLFLRYKTDCISSFVSSLVFSCFISFIAKNSVYFNRIELFFILFSGCIVFFFFLAFTAFLGYLSDKKAAVSLSDKVLALSDSSLENDSIVMEAKELIFSILSVSIYEKNHLQSFVNLYFDREHEEFFSEEIANRWKQDENYQEALDALKDYIKKEYSFNNVETTLEITDYQDDVTDKIDELFSRLSSLTKEKELTFDMRKKVTELIPSDLQSIRSIYLSFQNDSKALHKEKTMESLFVMEEEIDHLKAYAEEQKSQKLAFLYNAIEAKYKESDRHV